MGKLRMPAEWETHEGCLMAWPTRAELWDGMLGEARAEYAAVARAIAAFEPVTMVARPDQVEDARAACGEGVEVIAVPIDDSWLRDSGPIFTLTGDGRRVGVDFAFNSWGERYFPYDSDNKVSRRLLNLLGTPRRASSTVLEGGAITVDGEGTLITTEQCLLNANRNPHLDRHDIEAELSALLGIEKVIWLPYGHAAGVTDGHVDGVCVFAGPGRVVVESCVDPASPDYARLRANRAVLEAVTDARGRRLEIVEVPPQQVVTVAGRPARVGYVNFYVANGGVVVPTAGTADDARALEAVATAFPDRAVVGVRASAVALGGGGIHCITQQVPAPAASGHGSLLPG
ncbi:agmatine deiminase family protein [Microtetraspora fusca]|uniref:agmatine deiminase family protein n=1 Tax=Microtetraspora fusca TaxID=1997 RepID=UPI000AA796AF|nr:agmatine deiminase family protein [Microtetraspora fusca]